MVDMTMGDSVVGENLVGQAQNVAELLVSPLGRRWRHVQGVAHRAAELATAVDPKQRAHLVAAAWLHDVGYAPQLVRTGFHPFDGAVYLRGRGWPEDVVNLVAHHSAARVEAQERDLSAALATFPFALSAAQDALDTADLTTSPEGEPVNFAERIDEILQRYAPDDPVHRYWLRARNMEAEAVRRTYERIGRGQSTTG